MSLLKKYLYITLIPVIAVIIIDYFWRNSIFEIAAEILGINLIITLFAMLPVTFFLEKLRKELTARLFDNMKIIIIFYLVLFQIYTFHFILINSYYYYYSKANNILTTL